MISGFNPSPRHAILGVLVQIEGALYFSSRMVVSQREHKIDEHCHGLMVVLESRMTPAGIGEMTAWMNDLLGIASVLLR